MDLANMRSLGVRSIFATCDCGRRASVDVSALPDAVTVPALRWRLRCSACGARPNDVRPDWRGHQAHGAGRAFCNLLPRSHSADAAPPKWTDSWRTVRQRSLYPGNAHSLLDRRRSGFFFYRLEPILSSCARTGSPCLLAKEAGGHVEGVLPDSLRRAAGFIEVEA
jgi:hypothetical protein